MSQLPNKLEKTAFTYSLSHESYSLFTKKLLYPHMNMANQTAKFFGLP